MQLINVSIGLAFLAGLVSFFSPCVFSLMPAYIGYLGGRSLIHVELNIKTRRVDTFFHGMAFVLGFSFVFIILGIAFSALSQFLYQTRDILAKTGGIIIILFGLHTTGLFRIPLFDLELKPQSKIVEGGGLVSSFLMGIFFSAGWSPCVGPTLGMILTLAIEEAKIGVGIILLSAYSLGMAIPFLAAALGIGWVTNALQRYSKAMRIAQYLMGVISIIVGILLFLGIYQQMISFESLIDLGI